MPRSFAVIPAAGRSLRMGQPKLLLPWGGSTIIETVLKAWQDAGVNATTVTVHPDDVNLAQLCRSRGAHVVVPPTPPEDMRASIEFGLQAIAATYAPTIDDVWLVSPADLPTLDAVVIRQLLVESRKTSQTVLAPGHDGKRGHPVLLPWSLAEEVKRLPVGAGIDRLLAQHPVRLIECGESATPRDVDTPEDYQARHDNR